MEVPSFEFFTKLGVAVAAIQELKSDKNYTTLGKTSFDKLDFIESFLLEVAQTAYKEAP